MEREEGIHYGLTVLRSGKGMIRVRLCIIGGGFVGIDLGLKLLSFAALHSSSRFNPSQVRRRLHCWKRYLNATVLDAQKEYNPR